MNIIVTGGAGFIGSNFVFHMLKKYPDYRIICLDKLTYAGNLSTLAPVMDNPNFRFVKADICDREAVDKLFEEEHPDIVVNFAAESHVDRSIEDPGFIRGCVSLNLDAATVFCGHRIFPASPVKFPLLFLIFHPECFVMPDVLSDAKTAVFPSRHLTVQEFLMKTEALIWSLQTMCFFTVKISLLYAAKFNVCSLRAEN